ncbi:MAG: hypothetical protein ACI809_001440, partial [Candidatus Azotimanducaceae bacterium]
GAALDAAEKTPTTFSQRTLNNMKRDNTQSP